MTSKIGLPPSLRVLLVEDNAGLAEELQAALEELAHAKVVACAQAESEACAWMDSRTQGCDVAIIDVFLQSGSGLGVLEHMAAYQQPPQRVILTNYATSEMRSRCRSLGADAVFDKSTEFEALVAWLSAGQARH